MAYKQISPIDVVEGGTGAVTLTDHAVLIGSGTGAVSFVGPVSSTGALLASNGVGSDPGFTTATYPLTTTANELLYSSSTNTVGGLATGNDGVLITSGAGVPSISSTLPTTVQGNITSVGTIASGTWNGTDIAVAEGGTGASTLTGVLTGNGTSPVTANAITQYSVLLGGAANAVSEVSGVGSSGQVLTSNGAGADPTWQAAAGGGIGGSTGATDNAVLRADGTGGATLQNTTMIITDAGEMTNASQPAFLAYVDTTITNVTGDGTNYVIIPDTEPFDQNADFNAGTGTFTAPVTGKYDFQFQCTVQGGGGITANANRIVTSNTNYRHYGTLIIGTTTAGMNLMSVLADMDAADTCTFNVICSDSGGKVVDVSGTTGGSPQTFMSGALIC